MSSPDVRLCTGAVPGGGSGGLAVGLLRWLSHGPSTGGVGSGGHGGGRPLPWDGGAGDVLVLSLPVSNQTAVLAITWCYKWELYSIKIDSRVN